MKRPDFVWLIYQIDMIDGTGHVIGPAYLEESHAMKRVERLTRRESDSYRYTHRRFRLSGSAPGNENRNKLTCPCGFQGSTRNIIEHRANCDAWKIQVRKDWPMTS